MEPLPFDITHQMVQCIGRAFHYKDTVESFFVAAGVDRRVATEHKEEAKFVWAKKLFLKLSETDDGRILLRRILGALVDLKNLPDKDVPDKDAGLSTLRVLKEMVRDKGLISEENKKQTIDRKKIAEEKGKIVQDRATRLASVRERFLAGFESKNRQQAGYSLETILIELFSIEEIEIKKPYKTETQQIDGHFRLDGFDYLLEAKWTDDRPTDSTIGAFQSKVKSKLESTRGVFVSINGFRQEVIDQYSGRGQNLIFFTGQDLSHILEGRISLTEALRIKISMAAQSGLAYISVQSIIDKNSIPR